MLMDILSSILFFALGWWIGRNLLLLTFRKVVEEYAKTKGINLNQVESKIPVCFIESEGSQLYLYDRDTNAFYCQANTIDELAINLQKNKKIAKALAIQNTGDTTKIWMFYEGKSELA